MHVDNILAHVAQARLAQSKQKAEVAKLATELDMTAKALKDAKQRFGALQVQHKKKELEYEKLQNHLRDLLSERVSVLYSSGMKADADTT